MSATYLHFNYYYYSFLLDVDTGNSISSHTLEGSERTVFHPPPPSSRGLDGCLSLLNTIIFAEIPSQKNLSLAGINSN